jgi:hypothetical protein
MRTAVRRLCGQVSGLPSGVVDQSWARVNAPISPPPARKSAEVGRLIFNIRIDRTPSSAHLQPELNRLSQCWQTHGTAAWFQNIFAAAEQNRRCLRGLPPSSALTS